MKIFGTTLIAIGIAALAYHGLAAGQISYSDLGPAEDFVSNSTTSSIPLIIGVASLIDGAALLLMLKNYRKA